MTDQATTAERIGVLLVHGVGEQKRFQHLNAEVAAIVTALRQNSGDDDGQNRVRVRVATRPDSPFLDDNETWRGDGPTVSVDLYESGPSSTLVHTKTIDFHEIWWADLDETPERHGFWATIRWYIQFWYWGLTQWAAKPYVADPKKYRGMGSMDPPGDAGRGHPPRPSPVDLLHLFGVGGFFLLLGSTWEVLRFLARRVNLAGPNSAILVR